MYTRSKTNLAHERRGVILLVVITLLTLFAVVGLAFVTYAESAATASRIFREATDEELDFYGEDFNLVSSFALGSAIYDSADDANGVQSALRGHSLARTIYGYNSAAINETPFNGIGALHYTVPTLGLDNAQAVNHQYFPADGFVRDPERYGTRMDPTQAQGAYTGGWNAPYTYPDHNNMFLAAVKGDGTVLVPSFHRPWIFGSLDPSNPNWTSPTGKYLSMRPRPADMGPGFPFPSDPNGDVRNRQWGPAGNDSIWVDLGYPVREMPDGRKYKALFAFLIKDLDSLVNVNVHGNTLGASNNHTSNQGWGKWEVSLQQVLNANNPEWNQVLLNSTYGRYGANSMPANGGAAPPPLPMLLAPIMSLAPPYSAFDYNASADNPQPPGPSTKFDMPGSGSNPLYNGFPNYNTNSWNSANGKELTNHPSLFNFYNNNPSLSDDKLFTADEVQQLFCHIPGVTSLATSKLAQLCPTNFNNDGSDPNCARRRHMATTHSFDFDTPAVTPYIWDTTGSTDPNTVYQLQAGPAYTDGLPYGNGMAGFKHPLDQSTQVTPGTAPPANSEFASDWRTLSTLIRKIDVNRKLTQYPALSGPGSSISDTVTFATAQTDRQNLAQEIFNRLRTATGAGDFSTVTGAQYDANRWLAQLAVNIVDFIDEDDYSTPFNWNQSQIGSARQGWVFGTELPRLLINEFYIEYVNDPNDMSAVNPPMGQMAKATMPYLVKVWAELHNPLPGTTGLSDGGTARLQVNSNPAYRLLVTKYNKNLRPGANNDATVTPTPNSNVLGDPDDDPATPPTPKQILSTVDWNNGVGAVPSVPPAAMSYTGASFILIGPADPKDNTKVDNIPAGMGAGPEGDVQNTFSTSQLWYKASDPANPPVDPEAPTLLLQRLACPYLPPQLNPALGDPTQPYNPYITIDVVDTRDPTATDPTDPMYQQKLLGQINKAIVADPTMPVTPPAENNRYAWGRNQPYASHSSQRLKQQPNPAYPKRPQHTFGQGNGTTATAPTGPDATLSLPFDWLVHRDRPLTNQAELLDVSGFKPHELTQQFVYDVNADGMLDPTTEKFRHRAPWLSPESRIYRALEWLTVQDRSVYQHPTNGYIPTLPIGSRIPGRININTIWDPEILQALIDPQTGQQFTALDAGNVWNNILANRSPGLASNQITVNDKPYRSLAAAYANAGGQYPNGSGTTSTMLNGNFSVNTPTNHPSLQQEILTKILGNTTTRSNVFAVWCTIGYFSVTDKTSTPVKMGGEMRTRGGGFVRQQFFAVVDRTALSMVEVNSTTPYQTTTTAAITANSIPQSIVVALTTGTSTPVWTIQQGTLLRVGHFDPSNPDTGYEVVQVQQDPSSGQLVALFTQNHAVNTEVAVLGNPGPQTAFDYTNGKYAPVILTFKQLQ